MVRLSFAFVSLALAGLASAVALSSESDVLSFHRHIQKLRRDNRLIRRAGPSLTPNPGFQLVTSRFLICPAPTGAGSLSTCARPRRLKRL